MCSAAHYDGEICHVVTFEPGTHEGTRCQSQAVLQLPLSW